MKKIIILFFGLLVFLIYPSLVSAQNIIDVTWVEQEKNIKCNQKFMLTLMSGANHEVNSTLVSYGEYSCVGNQDGIYTYNCKTGALKIKFNYGETIYYRVKVINANKIQIYQRGGGVNFYARQGSKEDWYSKIFDRNLERHERTHPQ